jgi:hypothetical protein
MAESESADDAAASRKPKAKLAENAIQATRRKRVRPTANPLPSENLEGATLPSKPAAGPGSSTKDSDPWTVPESVRNRFVQDGHRFFFSDGKTAFRDQGRRLVTSSENRVVVQSLVEIAQSRGWSEVTVTGTDRFRQESWHQARLAGLRVRGHRPTEEEQAQLVRALARKQRGEAPETAGYQGPVLSAAAGSGDAATSEAPEHYTGVLLGHGRDHYRHDPKKSQSYFVRVQTPKGAREIWGRDIERALSQSETQPKVGEEVALLLAGREQVVIRGKTPKDGEKESSAVIYRNRWVIEKADFFARREAASREILNGDLKPKEAVRERPELAGAYLALKAADLVAQSLEDGEAQRLFVREVRQALAANIRSGKPLPKVRLTERAARRPDPEIDLAR